MSKNHSTDPRCRIGKVVYKNTTNLAVFPNQKHEAAKYTVGEFNERITEFSDTFAKDMSGFVVIVWDDQKNISAAYNISKWSKWGKTDLPKVVDDVVRGFEWKRY